MKAPHAIGLVIAAVALTVAIEEYRIAGLRSAMIAADSTQADGPNPSTSRPSPRSPEPASAPTKAGTRAIPDGASPGTDDGGIGKTARKMWDNPAGKAMMNQGVKIAVAMMYEDFIEGLNLSKEEQDYFKTLLGKTMSDQQEIGMKMMNASADERIELVAELEKRKQEAEASIKEFLNSDEDYQHYTDYQARLPERQQLDGIRAAFAAKEMELDAATESRLVEAMFRARSETDAPDFSGPDALAAIAEGNIMESFERSWELQEEALMKEAGGILDGPRLEAFREYRGQMKEMQLMGIKMAEKMMSGDGGE